MDLIAKIRVLDGWQVEFLIILEKTSIVYTCIAAGRSSGAIVYNARRGTPLAEGTMAGCYLLYNNNIILLYTYRLWTRGMWTDVAYTI